MAMQLREYAVDADYAHIQEYTDADENLIHINHTHILAKNCHLGAKSEKKMGQNLLRIGVHAMRIDAYRQIYAHGQP